MLVHFHFPTYPTFTIINHFIFKHFFLSEEEINLKYMCLSLTFDFLIYWCYLYHIQMLLALNWSLSYKSDLVQLSGYFAAVLLKLFSFPCIPSLLWVSEYYSRSVHTFIIRCYNLYHFTWKVNNNHSYYFTSSPLPLCFLLTKYFMYQLYPFIY